jgi:hypothetical protein
MTGGFRTAESSTRRRVQGHHRKAGTAFRPHEPPRAFRKIRRDQDGLENGPIAGKVVKLGFTFPSEPGVVREELVASVKLASRTSARSAGALSEVVAPWPAGGAALGAAQRVT